ncbi:FMN-binding glutamate synthase family protein [Paenibacillus humicola]|uniref:FMN-binding glutamate synthase family protein n=1 Tax=Paenibacillus humicola TaxID=3110540 RepID=UPI00237B3A0B|nr:FMN-binding glutamate synthase family protein [Paenibacillus humicola]
MELAIIIILLSLFILPPAALFIYLYAASKKPQHSVIRAHPYMGWIRYLLEKLGPEFRQYWFDGDNQGQPFSRDEYTGVIFAAKYRSDLIGFGSKRDFEEPGFYLANGLYPKLNEELKVDNDRKAKSKKYVIRDEGLFSRDEKLEPDAADRWLYADEDEVVVGPERREPWRLKGMFGASATSYGAVGEHYIEAVGSGARMAGGSWINTGEGGVAPEHLASGADIVAQIGPGLFGYRDDEGRFSWEAFREKAGEPHIKAFELKFAQGAKIRGGHLEGVKVNAKIASIRKVPEGQTVNSPNRFPFLHGPDETFRFVKRLQDEGGKPVGIKIVVGAPDELDPFFRSMAKLDIYPDFITVDGSEGGSGATFKAMADSMGMPLYPALIALDDAARRHGARDRIRIFASGKLITPDKAAIALALGADAVNSARGFMMAGGCIMAMQCHTNKCPSGVATTDPKHMAALVPEEKQWRIMNYVLQMRAGLFALAAACGLDSPRQFAREHVVFKNELGRTARASELFPHPETEAGRGRGNGHTGGVHDAG